MPSKYRNVPTVVNGIKFSSKAEAKRYGELMVLQRAGMIDKLSLQPSLPLTVGDMLVCRYVADFYYIENGRQIWEDVKSPASRTPVYMLKRKLVRAIHGIEIREIGPVKSKRKRK